MRKMNQMAARILTGVVALTLTISTALTFAPVKAKADEEYGKDALEYIKYIDEHFQERWANSESNENMRYWLESKIEEFGYTYTLSYAEGTSPHGWGDYSGYNIEFVKKGTSEQEVVVCAHYDSVATNGCEDNGTGVAVLLELAERFKDIDTKYTIRFILFDVEEPGCLGSFYYVQHSDVSKVICCLNMDCMGVGDDLYVYGGDYVNGKLTRILALEQIIACGQKEGVKLYTIPEDYEGSNAQPPAKTNGSDHAAFASIGVPYVYFASSYWTSAEESGKQQVSDDDIKDGQIMHIKEYDNYEFIFGRYSDRMEEHISDTSKVMTSMLINMNMSVAAEELKIKSLDSVFNGKKEPEETTEVVTETETETETATEAETEEKTEASTEATTEAVTEATEATSISESTEEVQTAETTSEAVTEPVKEYKFFTPAIIGVISGTAAMIVGIWVVAIILIKRH